MRNRNSYSIGIILLTRILFLYNVDAYTSPLFQPRVRLDKRFSAHSSIKESPLVQSNKDEFSVESAFQPTVPEKKSKKQLVWTCLFLAVAQYLTGKQTLPIEINSLESPFVYSTVSASLLRTSSPSGTFSTRQLLTYALVAFQIFQFGNLLTNTLSMISSRCSAWYISCLTSFPLYTKAVTSAMIGLLGDSASQYFEERRRSKREQSRISYRNYDRRRGLSVVADGFFFTGPLLHICYGIMENLIPTSGSLMPASLAALTQVLIDDIFIDSFFVALAFLTTGVAEGYGMQSSLSQLKKGFVPAVKGAWATSIVLMPLEFLCFRFLPLSFRVLGMNFIDIIWGAVLSYKVHKNRKNNVEQQETATSLETLAFVN